MDLYIYYRVRPQHANVLFGKLKALQLVLQTQHGVNPGLKRRPAEKDGLQTWMEIYEHLAPDAADDFQQALASALAAADIGALIEGERHVERFEDVAACA
ncbi:DUF4936 family protein [Herbaspirillum sp. alder98]|uniref:DUF4936 family protein n=1 Tax=Herbaspirillum sp. alder98 TaxID=2913096 RepID=UPI001CD8FC8B|nr:DUF4936 family protein [Herbaspirillum sp. alder98]MCA1326559.1 DUF4936 family protein [Herbaspirillum sp. alder98]